MSDYIREIAGYRKGSIHDPDYISPGEVIAEVEEGLRLLQDPNQPFEPPPWDTNMTRERAIEMAREELARLKEPEQYFPD